MNYPLRNLILIMFTLLLSGAASTALERWAVEPQYSYFENKVGTFVDNLQLTKVSGEKGNLYDKSAQLTVVSVFDVDCPLSLKLIPRIRSIESAFPDVVFKHVSFSKLISKEDVLKEYERRKLKGELLFDEKAYFSASLKVKTTCEVFLIDSNGTLQYRGAIDDQYGINAIKAQPENNYLRDALVALKAGKEVNHKLTGAPGCLVDSEASSTAKTEITYHKDISRIFQNKCQQCHHQGGVGPFELMTYEQAKERRKMIKYVIKKDLMPPWFAEEGGPWLHNYDLTDDEKSILMTWLDNGTPEGNQSDAPVAKTWSKGHVIKNPDLVVKFPKVAVKAEGLMKYQNPIVKVPTKEGKWIKRMEVRTENPQVLHHALFFLSNGKASKGATLRGFFAGYVPGTTINEFPEGTGKYLPAGTHLHVQLHYTPNGTAVSDQVSIAFEFMDEPPKYKIETASAYNVRLKIPPHEANYVSAAQHKFYKDGYLVGFNPHAHSRRKAFKYELQRKSGGTETLINIPKYDYNWQVNYQLQKPLKVMKGDILKVTAAYDNSENNKSNPDPTVTVKFGDQTNDEMMIGYFEWYVQPNQSSADDDMGIPKELRIMAEKTMNDVKKGKLSMKQARKTLMAKAVKTDILLSF
ncbi:MAG: hypothetical protein MK132_26525 [Lentisphaerales bacterium]|nr:hypothetical protein [Lentisphaerales bacterium]